MPSGPRHVVSLPRAPVILVKCGTLEEIAAIARDREVLFVVDNTFIAGFVSAL